MVGSDGAGGGEEEFDEEAELQRELANIRAEREEERKRQVTGSNTRRRPPLSPHRIRSAAAFSLAAPCMRCAVQAAMEAATAAAAASAAGAQRENPLLSSASFGVKRRWDEDVVFRGQTRGEDVSSKTPRRFINDSIRSDFHRSFMNKYIR